MAKGTFVPARPLTSDEREGIILAVQSAFRKPKNLYAKIVPHFDEYGFKPHETTLK